MPPTENLSVIDYSIVAQMSRNFRSLLDPPEIEYPLQEAVKRSESSGLPDGTDYDETTSSPIGEPLDKAIARMSREANQAWKEWIDSAEQPKVGMLNGVITPLDKSIEEAMLSEQEQLDLLRIKRLMFVEETTFRRIEYSIANRLLHECSGLTNSPICGVPENRFYEEVTYVQDQFGSRKKVTTKLDRCAGKGETSRTEGIQVSDVSQSRFNPSHKERLEQMLMSIYQTDKWRKPAKSEKDKYIPNISSLDDPDFITPSDMSSRNFSIYPPASRPYNATFKLTYLNDKVVRIKPKTQKGKDYTSLSSIEYMLKNKGIKYKSIEIDEIVQPSFNGPRSFPNCKFEVDIRVTYGKDLIPNPSSYKRIDPNTKLGKKLLQLLNEQPYLFKEYTWKFQELDEKGYSTSVKKVAVGYSVNNMKDSIGPRIYWVYIEAKSAGIPSFFRNKSGLPTVREVAPQYTYVPMRFYKHDAPNYLKRLQEHDFLASVRVSKNYSYYKRKTKELFKFSDIEDIFISFLSSKGYILYDTVPESKYNSVLVYKFIHKDTRTKQQRKTLFHKLTNHDQS